MIKKFANKLLNRKILRRLGRVIYQLENIKSHYPSELKLGAEDRILVLAPHPDDESIGCGGLLLGYADQVTVFCLTDGSAGIPDNAALETKEIRAAEFNDAMQFAGVKYEMLEAVDGLLFSNRDLLSRHQLNTFHHIFLPSPFDTHVDHCAVVDLIRRTHEIEPFSDKTQFLLYEVWSALATTNTYLDLSDTWTQKAELLSFYASQLSQIDYSDRILALNRFRGMAAECEFAESYLSLNIDTLLLMFPPKG